MVVALKFYAENLTSLLGTLTAGTDNGPTALSFSRELQGIGAAQFVVPHNSATLQAAPSMIGEDNLVIVAIDGTDRYPFLIRARRRDAGDSFDPITVTGVDAIELLRQAVTYPPFGIDGVLVDTRLFAWQGFDYVTSDAGWVDPPELGTYANPTDDALQGVSSGTNEVQQVTLNAESPPYPWGSDYPSPGGLPGTFTLTHEGQTTGAIEWDASLAAIKAALEALPHIDNVTMGGTGPGSSFTVEFAGGQAGVQQPLLSVGHSNLRHGSTSVTRVTSGGVAIDAEGIVPGWPAPNAYWIGAFGVLWHHRRVLRFGSTGHPPAQEVRVYAVSVGDVEVWWDGAFVRGGAKLEVVEITVDATPQDHVLAVRATGPTLIAVVSLTEDGEPDEVLYQSASGIGRTPQWESYEGEPPGVTAGFLLKTLFDEAKDRGYLPPVTIDFDETNDSTGAAWPDDVELGVQVGNDSVLSVAERLRDLDVYVEMAPDLTVSAWSGVRVDRGATPGSGITTVTVGVDDTETRYLRTEDELLTALLIRTGDLWIERHRAGPRREGFLSLGTIPSARAAEVIAAAVLAEFEQARVAHGWTFYDDQDDVPAVPLDDYGVGDVIVGPWLSGIVAAWATTDVRIEAIAGVVQANGGIQYKHEVSRA